MVDREELRVERSRKPEDGSRKIESDKWQVGGMGRLSRIAIAW